MLRSLPPVYKIVEDRSPFGLVIKVTLSVDLVPAAEESVTFDVHLEGKFPFQAPKLYCRTSFTKPSIADGRDLLKDVVKINWTPSLTVSELINRLPEFVVSPTQNDTVASLSTLDPLDIGQFHLGRPIHLETWDFQPHMSIFRCQELDQTLQKVRLLAVTQTVIIQLEPSPHHPLFGHMLSWASLYSLENIQRSKRQPELLTFKWKQMGPEAAYEQVLLMTEAEACISLISANMRALGVLVQKRNPIATIKEEEVTAQSVEKVHIDEILQSIAVYEANFEGSLNLQMVNSLMQLYQQAIEYLSALNDPRFDIFLDKLHVMLSNDVVQTLLRSESCEEARHQEEQVPMDRRQGFPQPPGKSQISNDEEEPVQCGEGKQEEVVGSSLVEADRRLLEEVKGEQVEGTDVKEEIKEVEEVKEEQVVNEEVVKEEAVKIEDVNEGMAAEELAAESIKGVNYKEDFKQEEAAVVQEDAVLDKLESLHAQSEVVGREEDKEDEEKSLLEDVQAASKELSLPEDKHAELVEQQEELPAEVQEDPQEALN
jgi:hypothetical protein